MIATFSDLCHGQFKPECHCCPNHWHRPQAQAHTALITSSCQSETVETVEPVRFKLMILTWISFGSLHTQASIIVLCHAQTWPEPWQLLLSCHSPLAGWPCTGRLQLEERQSRALNSVAPLAWPSQLALAACAFSLSDIVIRARGFYSTQLRITGDMAAASRLQV